ncbi:MAG: hypothetical protein ABW213_10610 [Tardiphaga sp.]
MTEHKADLNSDLKADAGEAGADAAAGASRDPAAIRVDSPNLAPGQGDAHSTETPKAEAPQVKAPAGKIMIMSPQREHSWEDYVNADQHAEAAAHAEPPRQRRVSMVAAVIALAAVTGAIGGSLATAGIGHLFGAADDGRTAVSQTRALEEQVMRLDAEIAALKISSERSGKQIASLSAKSTDRFDKLEKAQAEPNAKLAKLSETVEKLRATPAPAPAPVPTPVASVPAKEVTGSINPPAPAPAAKPEVARLPTLDGWVLHDVANGGATIEGRPGIFEVYAGDPVPGLGRIDAIRKQDGRWTVVTSKGLIVAR